MRTCLAALLATLLLTGCGAATTPPETLPSLGAPSTAPSTPTPSVEPSPGTSPPGWLGTRPLPTTSAGLGVRSPTPPALRDRRFTLPDTVPPLPGTGFESVVVDPAPEDVIARSTWAPGCPVPATDLAWVRLTFWGFDDQRHTGELLVNRSVAQDVVTAFRHLYDSRFPIEEMRITTKAEQTAAPTGDGDDTGSFNCRPVRGATTFSQHAYGLAVDVNPFQNPYVKGDVVLPELAGAYTDRSWRRPGMIFALGPVVQAFADIGWTWGGTWRSLKDLQHFSQNGR
ncbi:M15 family metallopeptidase [Marmoricola sp. RAF53]|uniref:M15 family metallopeptidase n=1 Tax=Marmoricola sp. RAF53 TaxID=3233059 RepID=UPI003F98CEF4